MTTTTATTATTHYLTRIPSKTFHDDPGYFETAEDLRIGNRGYGVGGWDETTEGRVVFEGPMVTGPVAFAYGLAVVISAVHIPHGKPYVDVRMDDLVRLDGIVYRIKPAPNQNIELVRER